MHEYSGPKIPFAWDPRRHRRVHIEEAVKGILYTCERCNERLFPILGGERIHYFRHSGQAERPCPLHNVGGVGDYVREIRESPVYSAEKKRQMRLVIIPHPDSNEAELFGVLPVVSLEELSGGEELSHLLENITVTGEGAIARVPGQGFHPGFGEVLVPLRPDAQEYAISIETPAFESIRGTWKANAVEPGDVFVGEAHRGQRLSARMRFVKGDFAFVVAAARQESSVENLRRYPLGQYSVSAFEVGETTMGLLPEHAKEEFFDDNSFHVDLIEPCYANPRAESPVIGAPGSRCLIAIIPPQGIDPIFEIIPIPLEGDDIETIAAIGEGVPRFHELEFPASGSKRITIHWGGRHRLVHLVAGTPPTPDSGIPFSGDHPIRVRTPKGPDAIPWSAAKTIALEVDREKGIANLIELAGPQDLAISLIGEFPDSSEMPRTLYEDDVTFGTLIDKLDDWVYEGCEQATLDFDALGMVSIRLTQAPDWKCRTWTTDEIISRLNRMDGIPKTASWRAVREVFGIPKGTPHAQSPVGLKKKLRAALREVKRHGNK